VRRSRLALGSLTIVRREETIQVSGVRCERCIGRLAGALRGHDGLEYANANLMGQVQLQWDDEQTDRDAIVAVMSKAGFRPFEAV
jgi:copper chaperone CopZ